MRLPARLGVFFLGEPYGLFSGIITSYAGLVSRGGVLFYVDASKHLCIFETLAL